MKGRKTGGRKKGTSNKVTAEVTHITIHEPVNVQEGWTRFRLQWEVSL